MILNLVERERHVIHWLHGDVWHCSVFKTPVTSPLLLTLLNICGIVVGPIMVASVLIGVLFLVS